MKTDKKKEPVDISKFKLEEVTQYHPDSFLVRANTELNDQEYRTLINNLFTQSTKTNGNGHHQSGETFLDLMLLGSVSSKYLCIDRADNCEPKRFRDFYDHCQRSIVFRRTGMHDYSI